VRIREHIKLRSDALILLSLLLAVPGFAVASLAPDNFALICIALVVFVAGMFFTLVAMIRRIPCPWRKQPLGSIASKVAKRGLRLGKECPHCGVSFDTEMPVKR
jgi:hypothetical protein